MASRASSVNRILVIRGGAIGDFVLTLPAMKLLRDRFPDARLEILGHPRIAALAEKRFYADAVGSIESASLAPFFAAESDLPAAQVRYFGGFDLILSYLSDPAGVFEANVRRCGPATFLPGPWKLDESEHAAAQLARPVVANLGGFLPSPAAHLFPTDADRLSVRSFATGAANAIALHPGSGSEKKNWPLERWIKLGAMLLAQGNELIIVAGEADTARTGRLKAEWKGEPVRFAETLPLPQLAALLEHRAFIGHDSGISHIAAAVGAHCILLFGPTNPAVWAPANRQVTVLRAPGGTMDSLEPERVAAAFLTTAR
jgi:heptosyltransferase-2